MQIMSLIYEKTSNLWYNVQKYTFLYDCMLVGIAFLITFAPF